MTTYLLHATMDKAEFAYDEWLLSKPPILQPRDSSPAYVAACAYSSPVNDEYSLLTLKLTTTDSGKGYIIGSMLPGLCLGEILLFAYCKALTDNLLPNIRNMAAVEAMGLYLGIALWVGVIGWLFLTPSRALSNSEDVLSSYEVDAFLEFLLSRGIASRLVIPTRSYTLFLQDSFILKVAPLTLAYLQFSYFTGVSWPDLTIATGFTLGTWLASNVIQELATREAERQHNWRGFQRIMHAGLSNETGMLFFLPLIPVGAGWLLAQVNDVLMTMGWPQGQTKPLDVPRELLLHLTLNWPGALVAGENDQAQALLEYFGRTIRVTNVGGPEVPWSIFFAFLVFIFVAVATVLQLRSIRGTIHLVEFWRDMFPNIMLTIPVLPSGAGRWATAYFASTWLNNLIFNLAGVTVLVVAVSWMLSVVLNWMPIGLLTPFLWYQSVFEFLVGSQLGKPLASVTLAVLFAPMLIWLALWTVSAVRAIASVAWTTFGLFRTHDRVGRLLSGLGQEIASQAPAIVVDPQTTGWPETIIFLPFSRFAVVRIPRILLDELDDRHMRLVLAHEIGHAMLHARKIWLAGLLSTSNLSGSVHVKATFDYPRMEFEADEFAVSLTGDIGAFETLMSMPGDSDVKRLFEHRLSDRVQKRRGLLERLTGVPLYADLLSLYSLYFGSTLVTYSHPSPDERITHVRQKLLSDTASWTRWVLSGHTHV